MFINLWKAKTRNRLLRESLLFKLINRVCIFFLTVFHEIWSEHSLIDMEQNSINFQNISDLNQTFYLSMLILPT